jgi:hypothetical protein
MLATGSPYLLRYSDPSIASSEAAKTNHNTILDFLFCFLNIWQVLFTRAHAEQHPPSHCQHFLTFFPCCLGNWLVATNVTPCSCTIQSALGWDEKQGDVGAKHSFAEVGKRGQWQVENADR